MDIVAIDKTADGQGAPQSFAAGDVVLSCEPWVFSLKYQRYRKMCAYCLKESDKLMVCSRCQLHYYCGIECQTADWEKDHKSECKMLNEMNVAIRLILQQDPDTKKDYRGEFGFCTAEILMAKIVNKIKKGEKEQLGDNEECTARDVLGMLPYDPYYENLFKESDRSLHALIWPTATLGSIPPGFYQLIRKVYYNAFPVRDQAAKETLIGAGLFPRALHRQMTPVCWGINVTMDLQERTLVVRATENIANFTGLNDLRQNELSVNIFASTLQERQMWFKHHYFRPCSCDECTREDDAEINPLKCLTTGCTERIPSDHRALQPCPECGAVNGTRLRQLKGLMERNDAIEGDGATRLKLQYGLLFELERANIVHPDAHFRYVLGYNVLRYLAKEKRYEEAWNLCPGMVDCASTIYPRYHVGHASLLRRAGQIPYLWHSEVGNERFLERWREILDADVMSWLWGALQIYRKLVGQDCQLGRDILAQDIHEIGEMANAMTLGFLPEPLRTRVAADRNASRLTQRQ